MKDKAEQCGKWRDAIRLQSADVLATEQTVRLQQHLGTCPDCREYADGLFAVISDLRRLASQAVEPSLNFRRRWSAAVVEHAHPAGFGEWAGAVRDWCRWWLWRNRRPMLALSPLWLLILLFKFTPPEDYPDASATVAHSPVEIFHALKAQAQLLAGQNDAHEPLLGATPKSGPKQPRSEGPLRPSPTREANGTHHAVLELVQHETILRHRV